MIVMVGMLLAGTLKGASGIGFPSIATPILATVLGVRTAAIVLAVPSFLINATQLIRLRIPRGQIRPVAGYLLGMGAGIVAGTRVLLEADDWPLGAAMGTVGLIYVIFRLRRPSLRFRWLGTQLGGTVLGVLSGALKGATNVSGPLMVMYLQNRDLSKDSFAGMSAFILEFTGTFRLALLLVAGAFDMRRLLYAGALLVPAMIGLFIGELVRRQLSERIFGHLTTGILATLSTVLIVNDLLD